MIAPYTKEEVAQWFKEWQWNLSEHFGTKVFDLIGIADKENLERLRLGFPEFVEVFESNLKRKSA